MQVERELIVETQSTARDLAGLDALFGGKRSAGGPGNFSEGNRSFHLRDVERIGHKLHHFSNSEVIADAIRDISASLQQSGISFEGRALPVSLVPTVISAAELPPLKLAASLVRQVLNRMLRSFVDEHRRRIFDGPLHRFFTPYYRWWDCIAAENRVNDPIMLMRHDAVRDDHGRWTFMETNTSCPGGTIHCAKIRDAWRLTRLGQEVCRGEQVIEYPIDSTTGFVRFMSDKASQVSPEQPNIAILNFRGTYTNELESLKRCHGQMRAEREIPAGELLIGDARDITCVDGRAYLDGKPLALIYNKLDQLQIDPKDPELRGWFDASEGAGTEFLNSLGAMYLAETKRTLALLSDPDWNIHLGLSAQEATAIREVVPYTRLIEEFVANDTLAQSLPARQQHSFVLKADALTRGIGVTIGDQVSAQEWQHALRETRGNHGVAQLKCHLPSRHATQADRDGQPVSVMEYYGVDVFLFGSEFSGLVSRSHINQVFNVGNGGRESPVLIVGNGHG